MKKRCMTEKTTKLIPINVLPVPGGPNNRIPLGGRRNPVNISGRNKGQTTISYKHVTI